jgi:hypothetical protein
VVTGAALDDLLGGIGPMPALCLVVRLKRVAAYVEPYGGIKGRILPEHQPASSASKVSAASGEEK